MPQECLICFDPILEAPWKSPNDCKCKPIIHTECWEKWSKMDGPRPRCIICREDPLLPLVPYQPRQRVRAQQMHGFMPRIQNGIQREIEEAEGPNREHRPCLRTFFIFFITVMLYGFLKSMMRHLGAYHLVQLPNPAPFRFRDEL